MCLMDSDVKVYKAEYTRTAVNSLQFKAAHIHFGLGVAWTNASFIVRSELSSSPPK